MIRIHGEIYGHGEPLVLLHGWSMHTGVWRQFARFLAQCFQVICLDLPGHGRSESVQKYVLSEIAEALMRAISVSRFHLLGWSLGGTVALEMARRWPDRIVSVTVLAGNPCFVQTEHWPGVKSEVLQSFADQLLNNGQATLMRFLALQVKGLSNANVLLKQLRQAVYECDAPEIEVLLGGLNILKSSDLGTYLASPTCPLRFILGDKDTMIPISCGLKIQQLSPEISVQILQNAGHVPFLTHQQQILALLARSA